MRNKLTIAAAIATIVSTFYMVLRPEGTRSPDVTIHNQGGETGPVTIGNGNTVNVGAGGAAALDDRGQGG